MGLGLLHLQDLWEEQVILPFAFPDTTQSAHLHMHFLQISQVRPMSLPALAAQTSTWRTVTSGLSSEFQARSLDLWCTRGDCSSVSRLCLAVCHCHHYADSSRLVQSQAALLGWVSMPFHTNSLAPVCTPCSQSSWMLTHPEHQWSKNPDTSLLHFLASSPRQATSDTGSSSSSLTSWIAVVPGTHHKNLHWGWTIKLQKKGNWSANEAVNREKLMKLRKVLVRP